MEDNQPKGIGFYNIKTGETRYAQLEAQIQAYINSSDMGINASRDQDFHWRLEPGWVRAVRAYRKNESKMQFLTDRNGGQKVTTPQILYAIYGEQLRAAQERADEEETPFEQDYLAQINDKSQAAPAVEPEPDTVPEDVNEDDLLPPEEGADDANSSEPTNSTNGAAEPVQEEPTANTSDQPVNSTKKPSKTKTPKQN